jgi:hypothetical protein
MRTALFITVLHVTCISMCPLAAAEWQVAWEDGPWAGPGQRCALERRERKVAFSVTGSTTDSRFRSPNGRTVDDWKTSVAFGAYLDEAGILATWQETGAGVGKYKQVLGPYRLYLVSVLPVVVVMVPHDYGPVKNRSVYDLVGDGSRNSLGNHRFMNYLYFGTKVPRVPEGAQLVWVSSDLKTPITPVENTAAGFVIRHPKVVLEATRAGDGFSVVRTR